MKNLLSAVLVLLLFAAIASAQAPPNACWSDYGDCLLNVKKSPMGWTQWTAYCTDGITEGFGSYNSFYDLCEGGNGALYYYAYWA